MIVRGGLSTPRRYSSTTVSTRKRRLGRTTLRFTSPEIWSTKRVRRRLRIKTSTYLSNRLFVQTGRISKDVGHMLRELFRARMDADYDDGEAITKEQALEALDLAR